MKRCPSCEQDKPIDQFNRAAKTKDGLRYNCRDCQRISRKAYYESNKERANAVSRAHYWANREAYAERWQHYYAENKETVLQQRRAFNRGYFQRRKAHIYAVRARWKASHLSTVRNYSNRHYHKNKARYAKYRRERFQQNPEHFRAIRRAYTGTRSLRLRSRLLALYNSRCHICGRPITPDHFSVDHIIPRAHGGTNEFANLAPAHRRCNSSRGAGRIPVQMRLAID